MAYEIKLQGLEKFDELIAKGEKLTRVMGDLEQATSKAGGMASRIGTRIDAVQQVAEREASSPSITGRTATTGPYARLEQAVAKRDAIMEAGHEGSALKDAQYMLDKAQKRVNNLEPKGFGDKVTDLIGTTRVGGHGAMPLVNRMANLLPEGMGSAGFGMVAAGAVAGMAVWNGAQDYRRIARMNAETYYGSGSGAVGALQNIGNIAGVDATAQAQRFGDTLRQGGYGAAYFRSKGLYDTGVYQTDKGENYMRAVEALATEKNEGLAIRVARDTGLQKELYLRDLSENSRNLALDRNRESWRGGKEGRQVGAELENMNSAFGKMFDSVKESFGKIVYAFGGGLATDAYNTATSGNIQAKDIARLGAKAAAMALVGPIGASWLEDTINNTFKHDATAGKPTTSGRPSNGRTPDYGPNVGRAPNFESFGGTGMDPSRYQNAVPPGWKYLMMDQALRGQANNLGAFNN